MPSKHNQAIAALIIIGIGVTIFFMWETVGGFKKSVVDNPYANLTRPVFYPESPWEGDDGSKLQIFEFADFACPTCAEIQPVVEKIFAKYGNRLVHVWKDFPIHPDISKKAAMASRCAGRQEKFWPYHDWLFKEQKNIKSLAFTAGAKALGLDEAKFTACLADKKVAGYIERDFLEGQALGVAQTPLMNAAQLRQWLAGGQEVGAHTRHHVRLTQASTATCVDEITRSKTELEDLTGFPVRHFCYPYGEATTEHAAMVRAAGFDSATTTQRGRCQPGEDWMQLPRVPVLRATQLALFWLKLATGYEDRRRGS